MSLPLFNNLISRLGQIKCVKAGKIFIAYCGIFFSVTAMAATADSLGAVATHLTGSFEGFGKLMVSVAYLAGVGFAIAAIFKFKQHKDNPTQIPLGTPLALTAIAICLVFIPSFFAPAGKSLGVSTVGGFTGSGASNLPGSPLHNVN